MSRNAGDPALAALAREVVWGTVRCRFERTTTLPALARISNVNIVPSVGDRWLMLRLADGRWEIPGGTLEPGETYQQALRRELLEEAGARPQATTLLGFWHCYSSAPQPFRSHIPHPEFFRLVVSGAVEIVGEPAIPAGGEPVVAVECVPLAEAVRRFQGIQRPDLAALYALAAMAQGGRDPGLAGHAP